MTTQQRSLEDILEVIDQQLLNPLNGGIYVTRDDAQVLLDAISDEQYLKIWTVGVQSGMVSALINLPALVAQYGKGVVFDEDVRHAATSEFAEHVWADPVLRQATIDALAVSLGPHPAGCVCRAPWHPQSGGDRA